MKPVTVARADLSEFNWQKKVVKLEVEEEVIDWRPFAIDKESN